MYYCTVLYAQRGYYKYFESAKLTLLTDPELFYCLSQLKLQDAALCDG